MQRIIIVLLALCFQSAVRADDIWQRAVVNYSRQTYHAGNQNWAASQARWGWMYFANSQGLLEFDGAHWTVYPLPGGAKLRAVSCVGDSIFVGGLGQFGVFVRDSKGKLIYHQLSQADTVRAANVWAIHNVGGNTYFRSDEVVYCNDASNVTDQSLGYSCVIGDRLYAASFQGIRMLAGGTFELLAGTAQARTEKVVGIEAWDGQLLLATHSDGLYRYDGHRMVPLLPALAGVGASLQGLRLSCAALDGDILALGTMKDGLVLVDLRHGTAEHLSLREGLQNKTVLGLTFDADGNLWLALDNGIDCIPMRSPLKFMNSRQSAIGSGTCSLSFGHCLYLGTNQGLYMSDGQHVSAVEGTDDQVLSLDSVGGWLFCGGRKFFIATDGHRMVHFDGRGVWGVRRVPGHDDRLIVGDYWGLKTLRRDGDGWQLEGRVEGTDVSAKTLYVEPGTGAVWVANKEKGVYRLRLSTDLRRVVSRRCMNSEALPRGNNVCIAWVDGQTVVASRQGLLRYDTTRDTLMPHSELEQRLGGRTAYTYLHQDREGRIWWASDGVLHVRDAKSGLSRAYLNDELIEDFENVSLEDRRHAVIGTESGFARLHLGALADSLAGAATAAPFVSKVYVGDGADTIYYGATVPIRIAYRHNSVRLELSCVGSDPTQPTLYSYRLEGADKDWSPYSPRRSKEYTLLPPGDYTFRLRAMTPGSRVVGESALTFTVLPPWYRTWWAYVLYLLAAVAVAGLLLRRVRRSRQRFIECTNARMERQQEAFMKESEQKDQTIEQLREENLEIELRSRQEELVRSRLNVVRKNEMLQEIRKTAMGLSASISEDNLPSIRRKVVRLIGQIDTNIEHDDDLEAFRGSFDAVHHDFLHKLDERFPQLTYKEKMLCAYLRMNLLSKEIAPLLGISTRGVEISRYRLRRKLDLEEGMSLTDFLQRI